MTNNKANHDITADEVALYDRQIRLWGLDAQQKIRLSNVLLIGCKGLSLETAKNIVLSGIKQLVLIDDKPVDIKDRSKVLTESLGILNPRVTINAVSRDTLNAELVSESDVVISVGQTLDDQILINKMERKEGLSTSKDETVTVKTSKQQEYIPLEKTFEAAYHGLTGKKLKRKVSPLLFAYQALWEFQKQSKELPRPLSKDDLILFREITKSITEKRGIPESFVDAELTERICTNARIEYPPTNAIVGGMLAQEILKVITGKEFPVTNFFLFDGMTNEGSVNSVFPN
ncbi:E1 ubiquitin-activating protein aos1 [Mycoemilia scoparia]|uniref:E1 ubiquitin-activating protein aos1 n=1 Tax=Mycoemilia scoparia TaxID=417184 RepID=A0A9W8A4P3_9FUNG|nr:E1 ubiquitin-activating protein aos1 [Mycoemilia scoparia]